MLRILMVDDERDLVWAVRHSLSDEGYEVVTAYDGTEALTVVQHYRPDLVILDVVMPGLDGLQVCHRLRRDPGLASVPILFLTGRSAIEDRIKGLDRGGDDYLGKPFDMGELKARIRALLRRCPQSHEHGRFAYGLGMPSPSPSARRNVLVVGALTLDLHTSQVDVAAPGGTQRVPAKVQLTPAEFDLLRYLMVHAGETFSSQRLLEQVWGYAPGMADASLVRWHIKNLRQKIEPDPSNPIYIRTIPHHGYMLERRRLLD
jgi:DNA-binding response OmpR family regulator